MEDKMEKKKPIEDFTTEQKSLNTHTHTSNETLKCEVQFPKLKLKIWVYE